MYLFFPVLKQGMGNVFPLLFRDMQTIRRELQKMTYNTGVSTLLLVYRLSDLQLNNNLLFHSSSNILLSKHTHLGSACTRYLPACSNRPLFLLCNKIRPYINANSQWISLAKNFKIRSRAKAKILG